MGVPTTKSLYTSDGRRDSGSRSIAALDSRNQSEEGREDIPGARTNQRRDGRSGVLTRRSDYLGA
eukprot:5161840-Pyramimonas_sp.AAC.1